METSTRNLIHTLFISLNSSIAVSSYNVSGDLDNNDLNNNLSQHNLSQQTGVSFEAPSWPAYLPIYVTILNVIVFFTGTVGNVLVIVVVVLVRDMRTPMNWYLVNLSIADLLVLLVCQPAALLEFFARDRWLLGAAFCKMVPFLEHASLHASTLIILAITVERYYAICMPLKKMSVCHKPHPLRVLPGVWSTAIITSVPFIVMTRLEDTEFFDGTPCQVCGTQVSQLWHYVFIIGMSLSFFGLPMLVLLCLYVKIIKCLRTSGDSLRIRQVEDVAKMSSRRSRSQVVKMLVLIVILFFVSLMPVRCVVIWQIFTPDDQIESLGPEGYYNLMWICRLLMYANSAGNPIIYSLVSTRFQQAFWRLLSGRREEPLDLTPRGSMSSRQSSITRWSISGVHRNSLSHKTGSATRLNSVENSWRNGCGGRGSVIALRSLRASSVGGYTTIHNSPTSTPQRGTKYQYPSPKQRSCTSIL